MLAGPEEELQRLNVSTIPASLRALLSDLIDYAGLFPPAALPMQEAVENYARYLAGPEAWALARFVLPVARFAEFEAAMNSVRPIEPWGISALLATSHEAELAAIDQFNHRNKGRAAVDAVEVKAATSDEVCDLRAFDRGSITCYFEIPSENPGELLPIIHAVHARAKIRTGGITPNAFPSSETVAHFIAECAKHDVAFKATAGLHHPLRCVKPLTCETDAPTSVMHGFLNVFLAAALARQHVPREDLCELLESRDHSEFCFEPDSARWRDHAVSTAHVRDTRNHFAISFGSCSFEEPLADLRELRLL
jgi:hypothetical protein